MAEAGGTNVIEYSVAGSRMARMLNLTERRLQQLAKEGLIPKSGRGQYPLDSTVTAYCKYLQETEGAEGDIDPEKLTPFKRKAHYQAETAKLQLMQERRELIPRIECELEMGRVAKIVTQALESMPDILERDSGLAPAQSQKVQTIIDRVRDEIHAALVAPVTDNADSPARQSA